MEGEGIYIGKQEVKLSISKNDIIVIIQKIYETLTKTYNGITTLH